MAAPHFYPSSPLRGLRQSSAIRGRACTDRNRWWYRDEAGRSLRRSVVHSLPCETTSDRRAFLLVTTPHRSSQRGIAVVDCIGRCKGRGAHCVSRAPRHQSGEGIWLKAALYLTSRTDPRSRDGPDRSESIVCPLIAPSRRHLALNPAGLDGRRCQGARPQRPRARSS